MRLLGRKMAKIKGSMNPSYVEMSVKTFDVNTKRTNKDQDINNSNVKLILYGCET